MGQRVGSDREDVVRNDVVSSFHQRVRLGHGRKRHRAAGRNAKADVGMCAGSVCDIDHVAVNRVFDVDSGCFFSHFHQLFCRNDGFHFRSGDHVLMLQDGDFILRRRIADRDADHEAVCLGIRELLRARRAVGVLRCHDDEGLRDGVGLAVDGKLSFLHDFQERGLHG